MFKNVSVSKFLIFSFFLLSSQINAQDDYMLIGSIGDQLITINTENARTDDLTILSGNFGNLGLRDIAFSHKDCAFYGILSDGAELPFSLIRIKLDGKVEKIGELSLANETISLVESIAYNKEDNQLYASASLNGGIAEEDFYSETIIKINPTDASCEIITTVNYNNGFFTDVDQIVFVGNDLYIHDGRTPEASNFYKVDFASVTATSNPPLLFSDRYYSAQDLAHNEGKLYFPTVESELYELDLETNTITYIGQTHEENQYEEDRIRGLDFVPSSKLEGKNPLVAYYPFNGNANDESGNGNGGVVNGATLAPDRFGNPNAAYRFDGEDDFIQVKDDPDLRLGNGSYTINLWAYVEEYTNAVGHTMVGKRGDDNENGYLWSLYGNDRSDNRPQGQIDFIASRADDPSILSQTVLNEKEWYNITIVSSEEENTTKVYLNGELDQTSNFLGLNPNTTVDLFFGKDELTELGDFECCDGYFFNGLLDDISIYCEALSEEEIEDLYEPTEKNPLVAYYPFNGNANDESGHGNDGVVNGAVLAPDRFGTPNSAYSFNGVDNFIEVADHPSLRIGEGNYTISLWANVDAFTNDQAHAFMSKRNGFDGDGYLFFTAGFEHDIDIPQGAVNFITSGGSAPSIESTSTMSVDEWYHIVLVASEEEGTNKIYINGELDQTSDYLPLNSTTTADLFFGKDELTELGNFVCCDGYFFNGLLDDISIYCKALSGEEIRDLYQPAEEGTALVQLIHNIHDQRASLTVDGRMIVPRAKYRSASKFVEVEAGSYEIELNPVGEGYESLVQKVMLHPNQSYVLIAHGTFETTDNIPVQISVLEDAEIGAPTGQVALQFFHSGFDATNVDLLLEEDVLFDNVTYGSFADDYQYLAADHYSFALTLADNNESTLGIYGAKLRFRGGHSGLVFPSGSVEEGTFGLWMALNSGRTFPLIPLSNNRLNSDNLIFLTKPAIQAKAIVSPNPARLNHNLRLELLENSQVSIHLIDARGSVLAIVFEGYKEKGLHNLEQQLSKLPNGLYFYEILINGVKRTERFIVK